MTHPPSDSASQIVGSKPVTTIVPGTTSNLGPGFDCLGIALRLYNRVTLSLEPIDDSSPRPTGAEEIVKAAAAAFSKAAQVSVPRFYWHVEGDVPIARGLGSSVTLRLGVIAGLNRWFGNLLSANELLKVLTLLEGHPDNAAPALLGGFTATSCDGGLIKTIQFPVLEELKFVLLIPPFEIETQSARKVLPESVDRRTAVASAARACIITAAFAKKDYEALRGAFVDDAFHQSHRIPLIPFLTNTIEAGVREGAIGGFLSGSGSTIICLTLRDSDCVGRAMLEAANRSGMPDGGRVVVVTADNDGIG